LNEQIEFAGVIAKGVETEKELSLVKEMGTQWVQVE